MNKIPYAIWILWHMILAGLKWVTLYPHIRSLGVNHLRAKHMTFHKDAEVWKLKHIGDGDDIHYFSEHEITCPRCSYTHEANRAWPRADRWPGNIGSTLEEATTKANEVNQYS